MGRLPIGLYRPMGRLPIGLYRPMSSRAKIHASCPHSPSPALAIGSRHSQPVPGVHAKYSQTCFLFFLLKGGNYGQFFFLRFSLFCDLALPPTWLKSQSNIFRPCHRASRNFNNGVLCFLPGGSFLAPIQICEFGWFFSFGNFWRFCGNDRTVQGKTRWGKFISLPLCRPPS